MAIRQWCLIDLQGRHQLRRSGNGFTHKGFGFVEGRKMGVVHPPFMNRIRLAVWTHLVLEETKSLREKKIQRTLENAILDYVLTHIK